MPDQLRVSADTAASTPPTEGLLVVLPADRPAIDNGTPVAGLPLLRRIALAGARAGFAVVIARPCGADSALIAGTGATLLAPGAPLPGHRSGRIVLMPANVVPHPGSLRRLLEAPLELERLYVDRATVAVLDVKDAAPVLALAATCHDWAELREALGVQLGTDEARLEMAGGFPLRSGDDVPAAERWLLHGLIKANEGFMSRHFERRLSLAVTRRLVSTRITPNAMTVMSLAIGLSGAPFFLSSAPSLQVAGSLIFLAHSILDGCDGELARLKFLESQRGASLDFWVDNVVHGAVFTAIAVGWAIQVAALWPLALGALTVASTELLALMVWRRGVMAWTPDEATPPSARLIATLVHRDFIYVILALSVFGEARWFVVITAVGAPVFLGVLGWFSRPRSDA